MKILKLLETIGNRVYVEKRNGSTIQPHDKFILVREYKTGRYIAVQGEATWRDAEMAKETITNHDITYKTAGGKLSIVPIENITWINNKDEKISVGDKVYVIYDLKAEFKNHRDPYDALMDHIGAHEHSARLYHWFKDKTILTVKNINKDGLLTVEYGSNGKLYTNVVSSIYVRKL